MIKVGIAGIGFMGWIHWLAYQRLDGADVAAIQSRDAKKREGDWSGIQGNFGPPGEVVDLSDCSAVESFEELLSSDVDLIDLCIPPYLHAEFAIAALKAGKHVFCEKPMALTVDDCDRMITAAKAAQRHVMVGHVLPFFPEYAFAREVIDSRKYGQVIGGTFKRVISDPQWLEDFYDPARVGGPLIDLHVHDAHFIRLIFGMPKSVYSFGRKRGDVVSYCHTAFEFPDPELVVCSVAGVINQAGRPFTHGFEIHLERATLQFEFAGFTDGAESMPLKVIPADGQNIRPELGDGDPVEAFVAELSTAVQAIETQSPSVVLHGQLARDAIAICQAQGQAVFFGNPVTV